MKAIPKCIYNMSIRLIEREVVFSRTCDLRNLQNPTENRRKALETRFSLLLYLMVIIITFLCLTGYVLFSIELPLLGKVLSSFCFGSVLILAIQRLILLIQKGY